jgi:23S rRNA pseudouridine1911/1915/1917 synthase
MNIDGKENSEEEDKEPKHGMKHQSDVPWEDIDLVANGASDEEEGDEDSPHANADDDDLVTPTLIDLGAGEDTSQADADNLYEHHRIVVDKGQGQVRIDKYLIDRLAFATRNRIQTGIERSLIQVNGADTKASYKIKPEDIITVRLAHPRRSGLILPEDIPLDIVYEDRAVLVVNKPAGMVVHPAHGNWEGTLVNALVFYLQGLPTHRNGEIRPGLVHRIDKDTSGLLVIAKTEHAMTHLANQFFHHTIQRSYLALVWGSPQEDSGTIDVFLGRHLKDRRVTVAIPDGSYGKNAITHYKVLERMHYVSLIECKLETGRTHQIRAHMKYIGNPLFADAMYGGDRIMKGTMFSKYRQFVENCFKLMPRQALHARSLGFTHPDTGEAMYFEVPLPQDMGSVLEKWRKYIDTQTRDER